jgi:phenylpropionate dioxygenase-like ring-hydroxylating dioxygenase large terminal subunit
MLTASDNELVTRTGPGTPMGKVMRHYWVPACLSSELQRGGPPLRLLLLGEHLAAFRDGEGNAGIMDHRCPHRGVSLFFGRVEQKGIRCVYHGWQFAPDGQCLDMPNVDVDPAFVSNMRTRAYPTREHLGVVWAYMGEATASLPELPHIEALSLNASEVGVRCMQRRYNWLQGAEGDIDTSHFGFLHLGAIAPGDVSEDSMHKYAVMDRAPKYHIAETAWGTMYAAYRPAGPDQVYWRVAHFAFPFWTLYPDGDFKDHIVAQAWVPMDDEHTMVFSFVYKNRTIALRHRKDGSAIPGLEPDATHNPNPSFKPNTTDWLGRWRPVADADNDYFIDRDSQRSASFSGLSSVVMQDTAIIESMGAVTDRTTEHLVASDAMVMRTRRALLGAARQLQNEGKAPPLAGDSSVLRAARSGSFLSPKALSWRDAYVAQAKQAVSPAGKLQKGIAQWPEALK